MFFPPWASCSPNKKFKPSKSWDYRNASRCNTSDLHQLFDTSIWCNQLWFVFNFFFFLSTVEIRTKDDPFILFFFLNRNLLFFFLIKQCLLFTKALANTAVNLKTLCRKNTYFKQHEGITSLCAHTWKVNLHFTSHGLQFKLKLENKDF